MIHAEEVDETTKLEVVPAKKGQDFSTYSEVLKAIFSSIAEGTISESLGIGEGGHPSFGYPCIQAGLEEDNPDAWCNALFLEDGHSSSEPFGSMPNMNGHLPPLKPVADLEVDVLGFFGRAVPAFYEGVDFLL